MGRCRRPCGAGRGGNGNGERHGFGGWRERPDRRQPRAGTDRSWLDGSRPVAQAGWRDAGPSPRRGRPSRRRLGAGGAARRQADACLLHHLDTAADRGREHRRQQRHDPQRARRVVAVGHRRPRRAGHRPEALSRPVRRLCLRRLPAGDAAARGTAPARPAKLLLCAGRQGLCRRRSRRLRLVHPPPTHRHRQGNRQRHEHGQHAGRLRLHLQGDRAALPLAGLGGTVERAERRHRCPTARPASGLGKHHAGGAKPGLPATPLPCRVPRVPAIGPVFRHGRCVVNAGREISSPAASWRSSSLRGRAAPGPPGRL